MGHERELASPSAGDPPPTETPPTETPPPPPPLLQRAFNRLQQWADAGWSGSVVLGWGLLQGCIFPGFSDLFFLPLALARPQRAYSLALLATIGTVVGSVLLYAAGATALSVLQGPVAEWIGITNAHLEAYRVTLARYGGWAIFASTMSPLSTKLTSVASGAIGVPWPQFVGALVAGRLARTMALAWLVRHGGAELVFKWTGQSFAAADSAKPGDQPGS